MKEFSNIKIGDEVWSLEFEFGKVIEKSKTQNIFLVKFKNPKDAYWYDFNGRRNDNYNQTLFWDKTDISISKNPIKEIANMLREEEYIVTECNDNYESFLQIMHTEYLYKSGFKITYVRNIFFDKNNNVSDMSIMFFDICNEKFFKQIKETGKKIKKLIKEFNQKRLK